MPTPLVALNQLLHDLYDRAGYDLRTDYSQAPDPPLDEEDAAWADDLAHEAIDQRVSKFP